MKIREYRDTALICENGHVITASKSRYVGVCPKACPCCGSKVIFKCPTCGKDIQGCKVSVHENWLDHSIQSIPKSDTYIRPDFCQHCGSAFPWMEIGLGRIAELIDSSDLCVEDKQALKEELKDAFKSSDQLIAFFQRVRGQSSGLHSKIYSEVKDWTTKTIGTGLATFLFLKCQEVGV